MEKRRRPKSQDNVLRFLKDVSDSWTVDRKMLHEFTFEGVGRLIVAPFDSTVFKLEKEEFHLLMVESEHEDGFPGRGNFLLSTLLFAADLYQVKITLTAMKLFPQVRVNRLISWYRKHGFRKYDGLHSGDLTRYPIDRFKVWCDETNFTDS